MKVVELYGRVRYAVQIEGLSRRGVVDRTNSPTVFEATISSGAALVAASDFKVAGVMGIFEAG